MSTATQIGTVGAVQELEAAGLRFRPRWSARRIALVCVLIFLSCAALPAALSTLLPPVHGGRVELLLRPRPEPSDTAVERAMLTEQVILTSPAVIEPVARGAGLSVRELQDAVTVDMVGRSNVLRVTVADRDPDRALSLLRGIEREYAAIHEAEAGVDPSSPDGPILTYTTLTAAHLLDEPLAPRPLQALAGGVLVGLVMAAGAAVLLLRPVLFGRRQLPP